MPIITYHGKSRHYMSKRAIQERKNKSTDMRENGKKKKKNPNNSEKETQHNN